MNRLDDPQRLEALERSGLLRKDVGQRLDHLTFSACRLLQADMSLLNAVDDTFQHTVVGYPPGTTLTLPIELTGCREVVLSGKPLAIPDIVEHPVLCTVPWGERYRSYLGCPISYDDEIIGSICVLSERPRAWKNYEISALEGVARLAGMSLQDV